jgi:hypothetical protein
MVNIHCRYHVSIFSGKVQIETKFNNTERLRSMSHNFAMGSKLQGAQGPPTHHTHSIHLTKVTLVHSRTNQVIACERITN